MIQIKPIPPVPADLDGDQCPGRKERERAEQHWNTHGTMKGFTFTAYKRDTVVKALEEVFHKKCAYCEFAYAAGAPCDVEHYRPKGAVVVDGKLQEPGYYWLAAEWQNLLPSCVDCNRARYQEFPDSDPELSGKANQFPVDEDTPRAIRPGDEVHEKRLLLHPYLDDPDTHLRFLERGVIQAAMTPKGVASPMGMSSILTYGLHRKRLTDERESHWVRVEGYIRALQKCMAALDRDPADPFALEMAEENIGFLKAVLDERSPFLAMTRKMVEPVRPDLL